MNYGRVGEVVRHVGGNAVASEGVLRHVHPLGDSPRRCLADGGACVPKVLPAAELEGILAGLIVAVPLEPAGGAAVSNDVEEPQELAVEPPAGDDAGEEGMPDFSVPGFARYLRNRGVSTASLRLATPRTGGALIRRYIASQSALVLACLR